MNVMLPEIGKGLFPGDTQSSHIERGVSYQFEKQGIAWRSCAIMLLLSIGYAKAITTPTTNLIS